MQRWLDTLIQDGRDIRRGVAGYPGSLIGRGTGAGYCSLGISFRLGRQSHQMRDATFYLSAAGSDRGEPNRKQKPHAGAKASGTHAAPPTVSGRRSRKSRKTM